MQLQQLPLKTEMPGDELFSGQLTTSSELQIELDPTRFERRRRRLRFGERRRHRVLHLEPLKQRLAACWSWTRAVGTGAPGKHCVCTLGYMALPTLSRGHHAKQPRHQVVKRPHARRVADLEQVQIKRG